MKKVLLLLVAVLAFNTVNAQSTTPKQESKTFKWKNGYDVEVVVKFTNLDKKRDISDNVLSTLSIETLVRSEYSLKNKLSFVPVSLTVMPYEGDIMVTVVFRGKNAYGTESQTKSMFSCSIKDGSVMYKLM